MEVEKKKNHFFFSILSEVESKWEIMFVRW